MNELKSKSEILALTAQIVAAHVAHNATSASALPSLIQEVHRTLIGIDSALAPTAKRPEPAVAIAKSVTPDYIICLEDGKKLKMHYSMNSHKLNLVYQNKSIRSF